MQIASFKIIALIKINDYNNVQRNYILRKTINKIFRHQKTPIGHNHLVESKNFAQQNSLINYFHHKMYIVKLLPN